jgi:glucose-1-phosphate cytidylyltransferase
MCPRRISGVFLILKSAGAEHCLQPASDNLIWNRQPSKSLTDERKLKVFDHQGFWQPMDTYQESQYLNRLWAEQKAPWKVW